MNAKAARPKPRPEQRDDGGDDEDLFEGGHHDVARPAHLTQERPDEHEAQEIYRAHCLRAT